MHEKHASANATTDHTGILDTVAQQGMVGERGPERV